MSDVTARFTVNPQKTTDVTARFTVNPQKAIETEFRINILSLDHNKLYNRDLENQHPISAVIGLEEALSGKQNTISDLATIRSNASSGASAYTTIQTYGDIVTHNVSEFATSAQGSLADSALQSGDNITELTNNAGYITGITSGDVTTALGYTPYDSANPNGYITSSALTPYVLVSSLATVATSGDYDDLINKPKIPAAQVQTDWNATEGMGAILNKPTIPTKTSDLTNDSGYITSNALTGYATENYVDTGLSGKQDTISDLSTIRSGAALGVTAVQPSDLSTVATSGDYNDLSNKPTIPTVNNGILDIQVNGTSIGTFTANQDNNTTANIVVPDSATWGNITGTLSNQTDLQDALDDKQDVITDLETIRTNAQTGANLAPQVEVNTQRIEDLTVSKFPNAIIIGTPQIEGGQVSGYSDTDYMQFPFIDISRGLPFDIYFSFTTTDDITTQQNLLDSHFGIALAIQNGKGIMALSSNGSSWDIGTSTGTNTLLPNTTYYVKFNWTGAEYNASLSLNETEYVPDMVLASDKSPYKTTIFIGGSPNLFGPGSAYPFKGTINFNKSRVVVNGIIVWEGMADVGLASRANVSLNNLDNVGEARFDAKQDILTSDNAGSGISIETVDGVVKINNTQNSAEWGQIGGDINQQTDLKTALDNKQNKLTQAQLDAVNSGITNGLVAKISTNETTINDHIANTSNPHSVTKEQIGLSNVDNTSDLSKPISTATQTALNGKQETLVSGTNIKTVNGSSLLGSGNITIGDAVDSVNGQTGAVVLTASDVGALPDSTVIPTVNNPTITLTQGGVTKGSFTLNQASGDTIALDAGVTTDGTTINTNSSGELQTIGVINQNDATKAIKSWSGTKAQYDALPTKDADTLYNITDDSDAQTYEAYTKSETDALVNTKQDKITGVSGVGDYVVEWKAPTSSDPSWYRKYKSGWIEQGGKFQGAAMNVEYTVTLSKPYNSTEYYVSVNQVTKGSGTNTVYDSQYVVNKTTGSFGVVQGQSELPYYNWKTEGMGA